MSQYSKGTFEAKQEQVEIVFEKDTEIRPITKQGQEVTDGEVVEYEPVLEGDPQPSLETGGVEKVGNIWWDDGLINGEYKNIKLSLLSDDHYPPHDGTDITVDVYVKDGEIVTEGTKAIKVVNNGSGHKVGQELVIAYDSATTVNGIPNPNNTIYGGVDPDDVNTPYWEATMDVQPPLWGPVQQPTTVEETPEADTVKDSPVEVKEDISLRICILEELKYEETDKELPCKPHDEGPSKFTAGGYEVHDDATHGIFKGKSNHTGTSGMDDVLLDWGGAPVLKTILPDKISKIHPHVKLIEGGGNVQLSWTMGDKYWDGFWCNDKKYLPQSYKYEIFRTKREGEAEDQSIDSGTIETYSYPDVTADVNLFKTRIRTFNQETCEAADGTWTTDPDDACSIDISGVGNIVSAGNHENGTYEDVELEGGSRWVTTSPRAVATVVVVDNEITSVTITNGGEGYAVGEKLTIPASRIGGVDATCVVTNVETMDFTNENRHNRIKLDKQTKYDRDSLRYTLKSDRNGTLEYIPGSNEKHLLYNKKRYYTAAHKSIYIPYKKGEKIQIVGKDLEPFQRRSFDTTDYKEGDTFYVKVSEELFRIAGGPRNPDDETLKELTSDPMRLPLNWVSSFSESDIEDSQKFKDVKRNVNKVRLEVVANSDNKGIELPELMLQVVTSRDEKGNAIRTPLPEWNTDRDYTEMIRNLFFKMTFTSAKVCIYDPIVEGRVSNVRLLNNGENYLSEPTVTLDAPTAGYTINDGTGKMIPFHRQSEAKAKLDAQGRISKIVVTDPGSGYGWKEGGYQYEKTDVKPIAYNLLKIKSGAVPGGGYITGAGTFLNEKFFSYGYQLANGTNRKVDPVSVVVTANPEDALSNTLSMGMTREEFSFVNNIFSKENSVQSENEELYTASEMSGESFIGGSPRSANTETPEGGHQDEIDNLTEGPASHNFINVTPDEDGGRGQEEDADSTLDTSPQGTSELDNRGADPTSSETTAKALGIVNDASLVDYRVKKRPYSKSSYPWISSMSSSTRPDYPMFFGNAPSTEISADAFNNMVDAANSLNKVNIDLPIYVRIKKHREETYRHVPDWGLRSKDTIDKINQYYEENPLTEHPPTQDVEYPEVPIVLEEDDIICGTTDKDGALDHAMSLKNPAGKNYLAGGNDGATVLHGLDLPFDYIEPYLGSVNQRRIATSITAGTLIGSFSNPPETFVKEINSINALELYSECFHDLIYGCFSKEDSLPQLFIKTTLIWCEYEILPFGAYAEAALGKDLLSNLDKSKTVYEGVFSSMETSCSWGASPKVYGSMADKFGFDNQVNVCGGGIQPLLLDVDAGTVRSRPITTNSDEKENPVIVSANGVLKIDPVTEVGGLINGLYGRLSQNVPLRDFNSNCFNLCTPSKEIWLTFPRGKNNGFILNLDTTKTDGADCF